MFDDHLILHDNKLYLFSLLYLWHLPDIVAVGTHFNVFSMKIIRKNLLDIIKNAESKTNTKSYRLAKLQKIPLFAKTSKF